MIGCNRRRQENLNTKHETDALGLKLVFPAEFPAFRDVLVRNTDSLINRLKNAPLHALCLDRSPFETFHWPWPGYLWAHREQRAEQGSLWTWKPTGPSSGRRQRAAPLWAVAPSPAPGSWCSCTRCRWRPEPASWAACHQGPWWSWAIPKKRVRSKRKHFFL